MEMVLLHVLGFGIGWVCMGLFIRSRFFLDQVFAVSTFILYVLFGFNVNDIPIEQERIDSLKAEHAEEIQQLTIKAEADHE